MKASGKGEKKEKQRLAQVQLQKRFITSTDCPQAGVNLDERSHTKRIKSSLPAVASMNDGARSGRLERKVETNWRMRKEGAREKGD